MLDRQGRSKATIDEIGRDPNFKTLVRERTSFAWTLSGIMLVVYLAFIFLAAFDKYIHFMGSTIGGSSISWGVVLGFFTIVCAFGITGVYVSRANGRFDDLSARIGKDVR